VNNERPKNVWGLLFFFFFNCLVALSYRLRSPRVFNHVFHATWLGLFCFCFVFYLFFLSSFQINICVVASLYGSGLESDAVSNIFRGVVKMSAFISSDSIVASRLNWLWNEQSEASGLLLLLVD